MPCHCCRSCCFHHCSCCHCHHLCPVAIVHVTVGHVTIIVDMLLGCGMGNLWVVFGIPTPIPASTHTCNPQVMHYATGRVGLTGLTQNPNTTDGTAMPLYARKLNPQVLTRTNKGGGMAVNTDTEVREVNPRMLTYSTEDSQHPADRTAMLLHTRELNPQVLTCTNEGGAWL